MAQLSAHDAHTTHEVARERGRGAHHYLAPKELESVARESQAVGLISEESNPWQYRFLDIIDPETGAALFRVEHEVRSMTHPLYARPLVNRNAGINNRNYMPGHEAWAHAMPPEPG